MKISNSQHNIPTNKKVGIALTYIFGIGPKKATDICLQASVDKSKRVNELNDDEMQNIEKEVHGFTILLVNALTLMTEFLVIVGLGVLMFYVNTQAALIIIALFAIYGGFMFFYYRNRLLTLGIQARF